jgi:AraC-like DNA-binding protein
MFERIISDIGPASPGLSMPWVQEDANPLIELSVRPRFRFVGLSENKARELRTILEEIDRGGGILCDYGDGPVALSLVDIGEDPSIGMLGDALPVSPAIAIVSRDLPDINRLFACGFVDYITYPFSLLEIQRRLFRAPTAAQEVIFPTALSVDPMVRAACRALETNIADPVTVDELAAILGTNRNTLNRAFNQAFGVGPITWLRQRRCEVAAQLLRDGCESILNIALTVGYGDPNNFSTAFRRIYNQGPMEFRKKCQAQRI